MLVGKDEYWIKTKSDAGYWMKENIMKTTIDIDDYILREVKALQKTQRKSLGRLVSDLLAQALRENRNPPTKTTVPKWIAKDLRARVDLNDKEALYSALERRNSD